MSAASPASAVDISVISFCARPEDFIIAPSVLVYLSAWVCVKPNALCAASAQR